MKAIVYFITHHSINWPLIWSDCSPFVVLWLICIMFFVIWCSRNYCEAIKTEYMVKTTSKLCCLTGQIDELTAKNKELQYQVRSRDEKGHFLTISGKGHKKKDWTKATSEELLKEANRRYKKGSVVVCLYMKDEVELISKKFDVEFINEIWGEGKNVNAQLYSNGIWAKKVLVNNTKNLKK